MLGLIRLTAPAVAAFGARGIDHVIHILKTDIEANMSQLGAEKTSQLADYFLP